MENKNWREVRAEAVEAGLATDTAGECPREYRVMCRPPDRDARQWSVTRTSREAIERDAQAARDEQHDWGEIWIEWRYAPTPWVVVSGE